MQTAQDIVAYLLAASGGGAQSGEHTAIRHAVLHGVREVMQCKNWLWHVKTGAFQTAMVSAVGSTGRGSNKINLSSTAGFVAGRLVDVAGFDDPVRIMHVGDGHITVDQTSRASSSGILVRPQIYYDLPPDLKDIDTLATRTVGTLHCRISPQEWQRLEVNYRGSGEPYYYTVMRSDVNPDRMQIRFVGLPTNNTRVSFTYRVTPKPIKYMGYERICRQGTVQLSNIDGRMTVTGLKTEFPQDCASCYIRFGHDGMEADAVGSTNPFIMERRIERWESKTSLIISSTSVYERPNADGVVEGPADFDAGDVSFDIPPENVIEGNTPAPYATNDYDDVNTPLPENTKYAITDVINASPLMYTAILSACEMWYARLAGRDYATAMQVFNRDLRIAMENDVVTPMSGDQHGGGQYPTPRTMGWHSDLGVDVE